MKDYLKDVKPGLALAFLCLLFGVCLAIVFGVAEDAVKDLIKSGIAEHPALHDAKSFDKIWRYWQRAHFHAAGIGAFTLALMLVTALSSLRAKCKKLTSFLIGLTGVYPLAWFLMALLAPSMGRGAAHHSAGVQALVYIALIGFFSGLAILLLNIFIGLWSTCNDKSCGMD